MELNSTAKFPRGTLLSLSLSRLPPPFSAYPIPRSFLPPLLFSLRRPPRPDRTAVQRGGCGVAYVCKSWPATAGCGTLQPCEYACTRVQRRRPAPRNTLVCAYLAPTVSKAGGGGGVVSLHSGGGRWEIRPCNVTRHACARFCTTLVVLFLVLVFLLVVAVDSMGRLFKLERSMSRPLRSMRPAARGRESCSNNYQSFKPARGEARGEEKGKRREK